MSVKARKPELHILEQLAVQDNFRRATKTIQKRYVVGNHSVETIRENAFRKTHQSIVHLNIVTIWRVRVTNKTGSSSDDWIY
jgi:hypothetical protein